MGRNKLSFLLLSAIVGGSTGVVASERADPSTTFLESVQSTVAKLNLQPTYVPPSSSTLCATQAGLYMQVLQLVQQLPSLNEWVTYDLDQNKAGKAGSSHNLPAELTLGELKNKALMNPFVPHTFMPLVTAYQEGLFGINAKQPGVFTEYRALHRIGQKLLGTSLFIEFLKKSNFLAPQTWASYPQDSEKWKKADAKSPTLRDLKQAAMALQPGAPGTLLGAYLKGECGLDLQRDEIHTEFKSLWDMFQGIVNEAELIRILPKFLGKVPKNVAWGLIEPKGIVRDIAEYMKDSKLDAQYGLSSRLMSSPWCYVLDICRKEQGPAPSGEFAQRKPGSTLEARFLEATTQIRAASNDPKDLNTWPNAYVYMLQDPGKLWSAPYQSKTDPNVAAGTLTLANLMDRVKNGDIASFQTLLTAYEKGYFGMPAGSLEARLEATWWHGITCMLDLYTGGSDYLLAYAHSLCEKRFGCVTSNDCTLELNALSCLLQQGKTTAIHAQQAREILSFPFLRALFTERAEFLDNMAKQQQARSLN